MKYAEIAALDLRIVTSSELDQVGILRVEAWNSILPAHLDQDSWLDEFDADAFHWGFFKNNDIVASARLTIHNDAQSLPDHTTFEEIVGFLPASRFAVIGRLVVHPRYRQLGLSTMLDQVRIQFAEQADCKFILGSTADTIKRLPQLIRKGFFKIGDGTPIKMVEPLGTQHLLVCPLPQIRNERDNLTIPTINGYGWNGLTPNIYTEHFIRFAATANKPVLDIGAGLGIAAKPALATGASVIANDLEFVHLLAIKADVSTADVARLKTIAGRFPDNLSFSDGSLTAVHATNVFHFLDGEDILRGLNLIFRWLEPGGKLFLVTASPYQSYIQSFIPIFEKRKLAGVKWPGFMEDTSLHYDQSVLPHARQFLHVLDQDILREVVQQTGFFVEKCELFSRERLPEFCKFDGREHVGLIAKKVID